MSHLVPRLGYEPGLHDHRYPQRQERSQTVHIAVHADDRLVATPTGVRRELLGPDVLVVGIRLQSQGRTCLAICHPVVAERHAYRSRAAVVPGLVLMEHTFE